MGLPGQECRLSFEAEWWFSAKWQWILEMELLRTLFAINFQEDLYSRSAVKVTAFKPSPAHHHQPRLHQENTLQHNQPVLVSVALLPGWAESSPMWRPFKTWVNKRWPVSKQDLWKAHNWGQPITWQLFIKSEKVELQDWCGLVWHLVKGLAGFTDPLWAQSPSTVWIRV